MLSKLLRHLGPKGQMIQQKRAPPLPHEYHKFPLTGGDRGKQSTLRSNRQQHQVEITERQEEMPYTNEGIESGIIPSSHSKDTKISAFDFFEASGLYEEGRRPTYSWFRDLFIGRKDKATMLSGTIDEFFKSAEEYVRNPGWDLEELLRNALERADEEEVLKAYNEWKTHKAELSDTKRPKVDAKAVIPTRTSTKYSVSAFDFFNTPRFYDERSRDKFILEYSNLKFLIGPLEEFFERALVQEQKSDRELRKLFEMINPDSERAAIKPYKRWKRQKDLPAFSARVNDLFKWLAKLEPYPDAFERMFVYYEHLHHAGPFFCVVQSDDEGQVNLMYEYRKVSYGRFDASSGQADGVASYLILLADETTNKEDDKVYDFKVDLLRTARYFQDRRSEATERVFCQLDSLLRKIQRLSDSSDVRIALLFYESPILFESKFGYDAFLYRCIRRWLRETRREPCVVAVFGGPSIADFDDPSDNLPGPPFRTDREIQVDRSYIPNGSKFYPPFDPRTTP